MRALLPQWSRSRRSGATAATPPVCARVRLAASMEPLPEERSDVAPPDAGDGTQTGLNGAAPGGAERPAAPAGPAVRLHASMEPLPEERSDARNQSPRAVRITGPQWSRSRRSGATTLSTTRRCAPTCGLNGAAPGGAERPGAGGLVEVVDVRLNGAAPGGAERPGPATSAPTAARHCLNGAAPGGAERRPARSLCPMRSRPCLNGAAPGGAERRVKSCHPDGVSSRPQWSRSRRSGATPSSLSGT